MNVGAINESPIQKSSVEFTQFSDIDLINQLYQRTETENYSKLNSQSFSKSSNSKSLQSKKKLCKSKELNSYIIENDSDLSLESKVLKIQESSTYNKSPIFLRSSFENPIIEESEFIDSEPDSHSKRESKRNQIKLKAVGSANDIREKKRDQFKSLSIHTPPKYRNSNVISFGGAGAYFNSISDQENNNEEKGKTMLEIEKPIDELNKSPISIKKGELSFIENKSKAKPLEDDQIDRVNLNKTNGIQQTLYDLISKFYLIKKFISFLRNATIYRRPKWLNAVHFKMINDWSFYYDGWQKQIDPEEQNSSVIVNRCLRFLEAIKNYYLKIMKIIFPIYRILANEFQNQNYIFHPTRSIRLLWDVVHLILIICYLYILPVNIFFNLNLLDIYKGKENLFWPFRIFEVFSIYFFLLDFLINLNTAYYDKGELIYDRVSILKNFMKKYFLIDLLTLSYFFIKLIFSPDIIEEYNLDYIGLIFLLRIRNLNRITARIEEFILIDDRTFNTLSLIKLIISFLFVSHMFCCLWYYISFANMSSKDNWLVVYNLDQEIWWKKYLSAYYFVVVVMTTVGFGDISPQNTVEKLYCIVFIYVACGMFAYSLNSIGVIVQDINRKQKIYKRNLHLINVYMKQKNISFDLRVRIRKYFEYIWKEEDSHNEDETQDIINKLSKSLKDELLFEGNGKILQQLPLFSDNFSKDSLRKLVYEMKEISFTPGDIIYSAHDFDENPPLFIIRKGEVELFVDTPKFLDPFTITKIISSGGVFGELSFFSGCEREISARSVTFTSIYMIRNQDFLSAISSNRDDYQTYCLIRDQIKLYHRYEDINMLCSGCKGTDHTSIDCPILHLVLSKTRILDKYNYSQPQKRELFKRNNIKFNARKHVKKCFVASKKIVQLSMESDEEEEELDLEDENNEESMRKEILPSEITTTSEKKIEEKDISPKFVKDREMEASSIFKSPSRISIKINEQELNMTSSMRNSHPLVPAIKYNNFRKQQTVAFYNIRQNSRDMDSFSRNTSTSVNPVLINPSKIYINEHQKADYARLKKVAQNHILMNQMIPSTISIKKINSKNSELSFTKDLSELMRRKKKTDSTIPTSSKDGKIIKIDENKYIIENNDKQNESVIFPNMLTDLEKNFVFDFCKSYEIYFPHNNVEYILENCEDLRLKRISKKKKNKTIFKKNPLTSLPNSPTRRRLKNLNGNNYNNKAEEEENEKIKIIKLLKEQEKKNNKNKTLTKRLFDWLLKCVNYHRQLIFIRKKTIPKKK